MFLIRKVQVYVMFSFIYKSTERRRQITNNETKVGRVNCFKSRLITYLFCNRNKYTSWNMPGQGTISALSQDAIDSLATITNASIFFHYQLTFGFPTWLIAERCHSHTFFSFFLTFALWNVNWARGYIPQGNQATKVAASPPFSHQL